MYDIRDITDPSEDVYENILDAEMLQNLDIEYWIGLAAFGDENSVKGVLIWSNYVNAGENDSCNNIEVVKVSDAHCANELVKEYVNRADTEGVSRTFFEMHNLDKVVEEAFKENGFKIEEKEGKDIVVTLGEIEAVKLLNKKNVNDHVTPITDIDMLQFRKAAAGFAGNKSYSHGNGILKLPRKCFEEDLSCCILDGDIVTSIFLFYLEGNGALRPVLISSTESDAEKHFLEMIRFSTKTALKKYNKDKAVVIKRENRHVASITDFLFPNKKGPVVISGERKGEPS